MLQDPLLKVFDSAGTLIATNEDWQSDPAAAEIAAEGLAPSAATEAATMVTLDPAAYTVVVTGQDGGSGLGLIEAYDLAPNSGATLANPSTRGFVGDADTVLIGGFIVGEVAENTVVIRALGPSSRS